MWTSRALLLHLMTSSSSSPYRRAIPHPSQCFPGFSGSHCLLQYRFVVYNKITKNKLLMNKSRDSSFENFMDDEKKMNILKRIIRLLLKQPEHKMLYRYMLRRGGYVGLVKPQKMGAILDKYPRIVRVYRNPNELDVWVTLAKPIVQLLEEEKKLKQERASLAAERLRKVLMMSSTRRIRLDRINYLKEELGLPDDFKKTVVKANPHLFKLVITRVNLEKGVSPSVKLLEWDEKLAVPAIESYRQDPASTSGLDEEGRKKKAYAFPINFPPNFKIKKGFRAKIKAWQELPYRSPYADTSDLDLQSAEAFKRAVAVIHEFLHTTLEKRTKVDHLAHLREDYKLPQKLGVTVLQNPGIFYMSTKSNKQTVFLREGYRKGDLLAKDPLFAIKEKFLELIRMGRKSVNKAKRGKYTITDSDTSEDEIETAMSSEDIPVKKIKHPEGLEEASFSETDDEQKEESSDDGYKTCHPDDEAGQESSFSDDECYDSASEMESNDYFESVGGMAKKCLEVDDHHDVVSRKVAGKLFLGGNEESATSDAFDTEDDLEEN